MPFIAISVSKKKKRNARTSSGVFLVFSWNGINVIKKLHICPFGWHRYNFLIKKKLHLCHSRRTLEDALAFLNKKNIWLTAFGSLLESLTLSLLEWKVRNFGRNE
jgi:hypothetical protein